MCMNIKTACSSRDMMVCCSLSMHDDSDEDRYVSTPRSPVPVAPKKRLNWLSCIKKQTGDENPLMVNKVGASPSDLAHSRVSCCFLLYDYCNAIS